MTYCHTCHQPTGNDAHTLCDRDRHRLAEALATLYRFDPNQLDPTKRARGLAAAGSAPGFGSKPPLDVAVLALTIASPTAHASRALPAELAYPAIDPDMPGHAHAEPLVITVGRWADRAREDDLLPRLRGGRTIAGEALRLSGVLDGLLGRWWAGEALQELVRAAERVDRALGRGEDRRRALPVGACPAMVAGPDLDSLQACRGRVSATPRLARCSKCGRAWHGEVMLRELGRMLGGAMLDLAALSRWTGEGVGLLRQWAHRDGWRREAHGRRKLYSLADCEASWLRRRFDVGTLVDDSAYVAPSVDATMSA